MKKHPQAKKQPKKKNNKKIFLYAPVVFLIFTLFILSIFNINIKNQINGNSTISNKIMSFSLSSYPFKSSKENPQEITAQAAIVMDDDSKVILFAKNENLRFSMASTTKIMTALTALDYYKLNDVLTIKTSSVEGSLIGFKVSEKLFFQDLLYAMLLPSANDAAIAISQNYNGGELEFIKKMNEKAYAFNLFNTHFSDPAGLVDDGDYTTVIDLARLSSIAMKNPVLRKIVSTKYKTISNLDGTKTYSFENLNKLLGENGVNGIKTGFTEEAGGILATSKIENGHRLIIVVMKSEDRFSDTKKLLNLVSGNITYLPIRR